MGIKEIEIRQAIPSDSSEAVPLIYESASTLVDLVYGEGGVGFLEYAFKSGGGYMGCRSHKVVLLDDEIVAVIAGYDSRYQVGLITSLMKQIVRFYSFGKIISVTKRLLWLPRVSAQGKGATYHIANLCVKRGFRRLGLGEVILDRVIAGLVGDDYSRIELDVEKGNLSAIKLYEKKGFSVVVSEKRSRKTKKKAIDTHHMSYPLNNL